MTERKSRHPFPWVLFFVLIAGVQLAHAIFENGSLQKFDILAGIVFLNAAYALRRRRVARVQRLVYSALDQGPQCALSLTQERNVYPSYTFFIFPHWESKGWIAKCQPPAEHELATVPMDWYCLTMRGLKELPSYLRLQS